MKILSQIKDNEIVKKYTLDRDSYSIGRSHENDLVFDHPKVSRNHARLYRDKGQYIIEDLNSTNYVFVNGVRVRQKKLELNDKVQISSEILLIFGEEEGKDVKLRTLMDMQSHFIHKDDLMRLRKVGQSILSLNNLDLILLNILKEGLGMIGAERGLIVLVDAQDQILWKYATTLHIDRELAEQGRADVSHSILREALNTHSTVVRLNSDGPLEPSESMMSQKIYSAMCAPLMLRERVIGLFYADAQQLMNNFTEVDQFLFDYLADQAAIAIVNAKRYADIQSENKRLRAQLDAIRITPAASTDAIERSIPTPNPISHTFSAGGIVLNPRGEVLIVSQKGTSWSLPKGRIEPGEEAAVAAQREIYEESGVGFLRLIQPLPAYQRTALNADGGENLREVKTIYIYLFSTDQEVLAPQDPDNPEARWVSLDAAADLLTHPKDKKYFERVLPTLHEQCRLLPPTE